jgi:ferredoxin
VLLRDAVPPERLRAIVREAASVCPSGAIRLSDDP